MKFKYIYSAILLSLSCLVCAMDDRDAHNGLIRDITSQFALSGRDSITDLAFENGNPHVLQYIAHCHPGGVGKGWFGSIDTESTHADPAVYKEFFGAISATKITPGGNFLFGSETGQVGLYVPRTNALKIFPACTPSKIIALLHDVVIDGHDKKPCTMLAACAANGTLHCLADDEESFCSMSLINALRRSDGRTDQEVAVADMQTYTTRCGMLPFVAFALRYKNAPSGPGRYANTALVFNPLQNLVVGFDGHAAPIRDIRFLPDKTVCTASDDGTIRLWEPFTAEKLYTVQCFKEPIDDCFGLDTHTMLLRMRHVNKNIDYGPTTVSCVTPSPCGRYIASIDVSGNLCLWDVDTGACLHRADLRICPCKSLISKIIFSPDSTRLCVFNGIDQKVYDVAYFVERPIEFSDAERQNGIQTFMRKSGVPRGASLLDALRARQLGKP